MSLWSDFLANDKRTIHKWKHYFPAYERHFKDYVYKPVTFIEIGCVGEHQNKLCRLHLSARPDFLSYFGDSALSL